MDNKKIIIIAIVVILVICAVGFVIFRATHSADYIYDQNGQIVDGKAELIEHLKNIEDPTERKNQIDFSVQENIITQEEANELY